MGSNDPQRENLPGPVADWVAGMRNAFVVPLPGEVGDYQASLAAEAARLAHKPVRAGAVTRQPLLPRRRVVFSAILSSLTAKILSGVVVAVAAVGGAAAAGVDVPGLPFGGDNPAVTVSLADDPSTLDDPDDLQAAIDELTAEFEAAKAELLADYNEAVAGIAEERAALDAEKAEAAADATTDYQEAVAGIAEERAALDAEKAEAIADATADYQEALADLDGSGGSEDDGDDWSDSDGILADCEETRAGIAEELAALDAEKHAETAGATTDYEEAVAGIAEEWAALDAEKEAEIADTLAWINADLRDLERELAHTSDPSERREIQQEINALLRERDAELAGIEQDFAEAYAGLDEELADIEAEYDAELAGIEQDFAEAYAGLDEELADIEAECAAAQAGGDPDNGSDSDWPDDHEAAAIEAEYQEALAEIDAEFAEAYAGLDEELAEIEAEYQEALAELTAEYEAALAELTDQP